ncbi:thiamine/thiamine pyrophosphate ABC transporter permease [Orbaceae bacterium ESL0727]|nr:thiamine/thiamine pyrophosphate ABC transporter permease [Orbaceae bacterium ESL0727]
MLPGISAASFILLVVGTSLSALISFVIHTGNLNLYFDAYLWHIVLITFWQALLSTLLAILAAILMAKALTMVDFWGKSLLLKIMSLTFILPSLVVVTGVISVYGQNGLLAIVCRWLNIDFSFSLYGLQGILLAHVFLNFPYACRLFYQTLLSVPIEQKQLAMQLNFSPFIFFKLVEWPSLKRQLFPMAALIFMLCFSSFSIVLALGGGPKYTTLEVAIYQAIRDFDLLQAVVLAGLQLFCCLLLMLLTKQIAQNRRLKVQFSANYFAFPSSRSSYLVSIFIVLIGGLFILSPLFAIVVDGFYYFSWSLLSPTLGLAILYSTIIAIGAATIAVCLALLLLWTNSRLLLQQLIGWSHRLMLIGSLVLMVPSMVLAAGFFLLFFPYADNPFFVCILMMICNGLTALPFVLKNLETPMYDITSTYALLSQSLNIQGWRHFYLIEYKALKRLIAMSFSFAFLLSLGDFGIIALFGGQKLAGQAGSEYSVLTLPYYLYEQIVHYRYEDGAVTALILLIVSFSVMSLIDYDSADAQSTCDH